MEKYKAGYKGKDAMREKAEKMFKNNGAGYKKGGKVKDGDKK